MEIVDKIKENEFVGDDFHFFAPYFLQGDDFADHLKENDGKVFDALLDWASQLRYAADMVSVLAMRFCEENIEAHADVDTNSVSFTPKNEAAELALIDAENDGLLEVIDEDECCVCHEKIVNEDLS